MRKTAFPKVFLIFFPKYLFDSQLFCNIVIDIIMITPPTRKDHKTREKRGGDADDE